MKVQHVPLDYVNQVWPQVEAFLSGAVDQQAGDKDYTIEQIKVCVTSGKWMLVVVLDDNNVCGAMTIDFYNRPNARVAFITYIGGRSIANDEAFTQLCALCKNFGATKIEGAVNESVSRLWRKFGCTAKYIIADVSLL